MNNMGWKGRKTSADQLLAWPREGIVISGEFLSNTLIPYGIRHGQTMLAIELYAADHDLALREPIHGFDGKNMIPLNRSNDQYRMTPPLWVPSRTQFADYLAMRGLSLVL
nr:DnaT-like ssDNA-binding protein [Pseudomonas viridiflava]